MLFSGNMPEICSVFEVFKRGTQEIQNDMELIRNSTDDLENLLEVYEENIHTLLYLLVIILKLKPNIEEMANVCSWVYKFLQQKPSLRNGFTPLHMSASHGTIVDDFHVNDVVTFPNGNLCKLLIDCGSNVNARDNFGNTALHLIVQYINPINDFDNLHSCMMALLGAGAHIDICNKDGETALDVATTGVAEVIIRTNYVISLRCLASRVIKKCDIPYHGLIPTDLEDFVMLH